MKKIFAIAAVLGLLSTASIALAAPLVVPQPVFKPTCTVSASPLFQVNKTHESVLVIWQSVFATNEKLTVTNPGPAVLFTSTALNRSATIVVDTTVNSTFTLVGTNGFGSVTCSQTLKAK